MFNTTVKTDWMKGSSRDMKLLETVIFTDSNKKLWRASKGSVINGASIPRVLWGIMGSPFVGAYRRASVIHDVYYNLEVGSRKEIDKMFLEGMLADGVPKWKASSMYRGVRMFGKRF